MPLYKLRTLLILLAVLPPVLGWIAPPVAVWLLKPPPPLRTKWPGEFSSLAKGRRRQRIQIRTLPGRLIV